MISRCIDFDSCRYNGQVIRASLREELEPHVDLVPICPELEIGLGVPRDPIRLVGRGRREVGSYSRTGRDLTQRDGGLHARWLGGAGEVDGFILKSRSPSCGVGSAKVHQPDDRGPPAARFRHVRGRRAGALPRAAIEEETRLGNPLIRDLFLTRLFTLADFRSRRAAQRSTGGAGRFPRSQRSSC